MQDFWIDLGFSALISLLKTLIQPGNPGGGKWKAAFLKLFKLIAQAYGDDPAFKEAAKGIK